ncbi:MAG: AAA family ATPase [candidate division WOR-3 bacterium]
MIKKLKISNFRSIQNQEIEIAPLTIIYGPTASGKSSILYSLLVLKNFILNPNQNADNFFNFGFMNLGGFNDVVFNHHSDLNIELKFIIEEGEYGICLGKGFSEVLLNYKSINLKAKIPIPYNLNQNFQFPLKIEDKEFTINFNGLNSSIVPKQPTAENQSIATDIAKEINKIPEYLKKVDIAPHKRGFFKPFYTPTTITQNPISDDEVATIIINDPYLASKISVDLEIITNREFRIYIPPGTSIAYFQTSDKNARVPTYITNDGFGVNQIVYLLAKIHRQDIKTILIEEPEIHLHPSIIRALVKTLCSIVSEEKKQIILTTHSEVFISSVLASVRRKDIFPEQVKCYLAKKEKKSTKLEEQKINEKGQIEGGLSSFLEGELEDLKVFFED